MDKSNTSKLLNKKRKTIISSSFKKIFTVSYINLYSHFIIDLKNPHLYYDLLKNKNSIKLTNIEFDFLKQKIKDLSFDNNYTEDNHKIIELPKDLCEDINKFFKVNARKNKVEEFIEKKLNENKSRNNISCRKLAKAYAEETGKKISKSYINNLLRNNFKLSYLKTTIKTTNLTSASGIFSAMYFIKTIVKCISLGYKILFLDESAIQSINNNYRAWRIKTEELYFNIGCKKKKNLLLLVSDQAVIHYKIIDENTNEDIFYMFMEEVTSKLALLSNEKFVIVMDNLSSHRTEKLMKYYIDNRLNIIFNCVYRSNFNSVELAFKIIKLHLYNNLYETLDEVVEDIKKKLDEKNFNSVLSHNYLETLNVYLEFYEQNKNINLNTLKI